MKKRPFDGEQGLETQTSDVSDSVACGGADTADKGTVYVLSGPVRVKLYPTQTSQVWAQCEYKDKRSTYSLIIVTKGQLWLDAAGFLGRK